MRRRAFRPNPPADLEARVAPSGGPLARPFALSSNGYNATIGAIQGYFGQYASGDDIKLLRTQLAGQELQVPFGRADGLGEQTRAILDRMRAAQAHHARDAISRADDELAATIRSQVEARIADGSVVIYKR